MSSFIPNTPCPCESGLDYVTCCGNPEIESINIISKINAVGQGNSNLTQELIQALDDFKQSPEIFPLNINFQEQKSTCVKMSPFWFSESVFLDSTRINGTCALECDLKWLAEAADTIEYQYTPFIFHTAFCGSTLISRALELIYNSLPLREPDLLYSLLDLDCLKDIPSEVNKQWYERVLKILSRRFEQSQPALVKANDYANPIIESLLAYNSKFPVLFLFTPFSEFFAGCLRAESRQTWIANRYHLISPNLEKLFPDANLPLIADEDYSKMAAIIWSYNIKHFLKACENYPTRIKTLNFNTFLDNPLQTLEACANWFNLSQRDDIHPTVEMSWLMNVYSKNPDYTYNLQTRNNDINNTLAKYSNELIEAEFIVSDLLGEYYPLNALPEKLL